MTAVTADDPWEDHAVWWQREFTEGADPEYAEQIVPLAVALTGAAERALDIGCGEGQVARALLAAGVSSVVGVDLAAGQVTEAGRRGGGARYARAGADALPFADGSFDAVIVSLVWEHVDAIDDAIAEAARVLAPAGHLVLLINHPWTQTPNSGWIDDQVLDPPEQYWRIGPYLPESATVEEVDKGIFVRFLHRPLSRYVNAMAAAGLHIERMIEPSPPPGFLALAPEYTEAATIPRLLALRCRRS